MPARRKPRSPRRSKSRSKSPRRVLKHRSWGKALTSRRAVVTRRSPKRRTSPVGRSYKGSPERLNEDVLSVVAGHVPPTIVTVTVSSVYDEEARSRPNWSETITMHGLNPLVGDRWVDEFLGRPKDLFPGSLYTNVNDVHTWAMEDVPSLPYKDVEVKKINSAFIWMFQNFETVTKEHVSELTFTITYAVRQKNASIINALLPTDQVVNVPNLPPGYKVREAYTSTVESSYDVTTPEGKKVKILFLLIKYWKI